MVPMRLVLGAELFPILGADGNTGERAYAVFAVAFRKRCRIDFRDLPLVGKWLMLRPRARSAQMLTTVTRCTDNGFNICGIWIFDEVWL